MKQLCSERMVTHTRGGRTYRVYEKVGANVRNEALDVRVYATVARVILNPNYEAIAKRRLQHTEPADAPESVDRIVTDEPTNDPPAPVTPKKKAKILSFRSSRFS
jgi:phage terminase large subunit GpA-like protein